MDSDAIRKSRLEELAEKRKRLDQMRALREEKKSAAPASDVPATSPKNVAVTHRSEEIVAQKEPANVASVDVTHKKVVNFTTSKAIGKFDILPAVHVSYHKETQTDFDSFDESDVKTNHDLHVHVEHHEKLSKTVSFTTNTIEEEVSTLVHFTEEEKIKLMKGEPFNTFLNSASLLVEKALEQSETFDIFQICGQNEEKDSNSEENLKYEKMTPFEDEQVYGRPIMDLSWNQHLPDVFVAAYGLRVNKSKTVSFNSNQVEEHPGMVCVWSTNLHSRAQFKFGVASPVLTASFHPHNENIVFGGCYNGQILLWDLRTPKINPVQRSSMSGKGHKHPVYAMSITATTSNTNELVSVSTDGMLCLWDVSRLSEPHTSVMLNLPTAGLGALGAGPAFGGQQSWLDGDSVRDGNAPLNISTMSFEMSNEQNSIVLGCGSGHIFKCNLPYKATELPLSQSQAHYGLITAIHPHPNRSKKLKNLVLTSSVDWSVKLWSLKSLATPLLEFTGTNYDYITDVKWSPVHPLVFCTVSSGGILSLWNLSKSTSVPVESCALFAEAEDKKDDKKVKKALFAGSAGSWVGALNKSMWSHDGHSIFIGDSYGAVRQVKWTSSVFATGLGDESGFENLLSQHTALK